MTHELLVIIIIIIKEKACKKGFREREKQVTKMMEKTSNDGNVSTVMSQTNDTNVTHFQLYFIKIQTTLFYI
jgi:hypothetical protein